MDITYVGESDGGSFELFHYMADGNRPVLEILIDRQDKIWVGRVNDGIPQMTKGEVHRHSDAELEAAGIDSQHVCLGAIAAYVVPRIATLMARVYCPTQSVNVNE